MCLEKAVSQSLRCIKTYLLTDLLHNEFIEHFIIIISLYVRYVKDKDK